ATRTFRPARVHLNGAYTFGADPGEGEDAGEVSRWMAGVAVDRAFPLRSALLTGDLFVERPLHGSDDLAWTVEAGVRYQLSPKYNVDLGVGRRLTGDEPGWSFTFGTAYAFAVRSLLPLR
ncbi:MAG TPA: hypothetical protein VHG28_18880, partial [Longimicrobiaceae bacterium]|nr:hypothetical protein [Longimicrobiaceae bacterium]